MIRLLALFITFFLLNNCSFNENSRIWKDKEKDLSEKENVKKIFAEEEVKVSEFNQEVKKATDPIYRKISKVMPEIEWSVHAPYIHRINQLKKENMCNIFEELLSLFDFRNI